MKRTVGALTTELEKQIEGFTKTHGKVLDYIKSAPSDAPASTAVVANNPATSPARTPARTHVRPDFTDDELAKDLQRNRAFEPDFLNLNELETAKKSLGHTHSNSKQGMSRTYKCRLLTNCLRILVQGPCVACSDVQLAWTEDKRLYLVNRTDQEHVIKGELFGYNVGQFEEKVKGWEACSAGVLDIAWFAVWGSW